MARKRKRELAGKTSEHAQSGAAAYSKLEDISGVEQPAAERGRGPAENAASWTGRAAAGETRGPQSSPHGTAGSITIDDSVPAHVACRAAEAVPGVVVVGAPSMTRSFARALGGERPGGRGVDVNSSKMTTAFDIAVVVDHGRSIPDMAGRVKQEVAGALKRTCGLEVTRTNVHIADITDARQPRDAEAAPTVGRRQ